MTADCGLGAFPWVPVRCEGVVLPRVTEGYVTFNDLLFPMCVMTHNSGGKLANQQSPQSTALRLYNSNTNNPCILRKTPVWRFGLV